jgi:hypothetical protein
MADHQQNKQAAVAFYSEAFNDKRPDEAGPSHGRVMLHACE